MTEQKQSWSADVEVSEELARMTREQLIAEVTDLRRAMQSRAVIEQAKGVLMGTRGCGPSEAFNLLVTQSQHENRKLREVAADLVAVQDRRPASGADRPAAEAVRRWIRRRQPPADSGTSDT